MFCMDPEKKNIVARILELATGVMAVTTVVLLSSVAGLNAYLAYQPSALEAQAINISLQEASTSSAVSGETPCQQEIAGAAARGYPDAEVVLPGQNNTQFQNQCVAAVLNGAVSTALSTSSPDSYMCVGESARISVNTSGTVTETAVPDVTVPAGTCTVIACTSYGTTGQSGCVAAESINSLNDPIIESSSGAIQIATVSPDSKVFDLSLNADESPAMNSLSPVQNFFPQQYQTTGTTSGGLPSIGEDQAVASEPPEIPQPPAQAPMPIEATSTATASTTSSVATSSPPTPILQPVPATNNVAPPTQIPGSSGASIPSELPTAQFNNNSQATTSTVENATTETPPVAETTSTGLLGQFTGAIQSGSATLLNKIFSLIGLAPVGQ
jgi:hypothetical protein